MGGFKQCLAATVCIDHPAKYAYRRWYPVYPPKKQSSAQMARCKKFQVAPHWLLECDNTRAQSGHPGGINVCLGDGSVRFLGKNMDELTWSRACDPRDGQANGTDW